MRETLAAMRDMSQPRVGSIIRARRQQMQMTLTALSQASGVSVGYLSQVERDQAVPSLGTLAQIARALGVGIDYFIAAPTPRDALTREGERTKFSVDGSSVIYERLGSDFPGNTLSSFVMTVPPGYRSELVSHEGEEIIYVLEGSITQRVDNEEMIMSAGDSLHFRGSQPHAWSNHTDRPAKLLWAGTLALFRSNAAPKPAAQTAKPNQKEEN